MSESAPGVSPVPVSRDDTWRVLLGRIKDGDQDAFESFYDQTGALVFGIVKRMTESQADAEEIALDVYKQIWRATGSYEESRGSVTAWLVTMARSRALDRIRSKASRARIEQPWEATSGFEPSHSGFENRTMFALDYQRVTAALAAIPPEQRHAIEMSFFQGLSHSEVSETLGMPVGTIKTRIRQGMLKLRRILEKEA
jgi:RNA polymerase sigma-70 factor, ECF subfamily